MPTAKSTTKKSATPIRRSRKAASDNHVVPLAASHKAHNLCHGCHALPAGSIELVALLLVLVFSLSAVLFTSVYALQMEKAEVQQLQAQLQ